MQIPRLDLSGPEVIVPDNFGPELIINSLNANSVAFLDR
jgi:hypothetical protein